MIILAYILSGLSLLMSILFLIQSKMPVGWLVLVPKLFAAALSPYWAIMGAAGAVIGWVYQALWAIPIGIVGAGMMIYYVWRCTRDHKDFEMPLVPTGLNKYPQRKPSGWSKSVGHGF